MPFSYSNSNLIINIIRKTLHCIIRQPQQLQLQLQLQVQQQKQLNIGHPKAGIGPHLLVLAFIVRSSCLLSLSLSIFIAIVLDLGLDLLASSSCFQL